jgi:hypothetical protein
MIHVPVHYYVWYRIEGDAAAVRAAVNGVLHDVSLACAVTGRVLVRRKDPTTWMEVWEPVTDPEAFEAALAAAVARHGLEALVAGGRHVERFIVAP